MTTSSNYNGQIDCRLFSSSWCLSFQLRQLALNADNLAANRVTYVAATGAVDIVGYILSIVLLNFFGRKMSSCGLFGLSGIFLLSLCFVPRGNSISYFKKRYLKK